MNGNWIAPVGVADRKNCYFRVRKCFELDAVPEEALLHIAAESYYALWVNGHLLGRSSARGTKDLNYYDTYEVSAYLRNGGNTVAVLAQNMNIKNFTTIPCRPGVVVELEGIVSTDAGWEVLLNAEWREEVELFCVQVGFMEYRDLRETPLGWQIGTDRSEWTRPTVIGDSAAMDGKMLLPRPIPLLKTRKYAPVEVVRTAWVEPSASHEALSPAQAVSELKHDKVNCFAGAFQDLLLEEGKAVEIIPPVDGSDVSVALGFDREIIGFFELDLSAPAGTTIDISYDEELEDGRLVSVHGIYSMTDRYVAREGRQAVGNTIHERGFRYVEVVIRSFDSPVVLHGARALDRRYPFVSRGSFHCSDFKMNRIWEISLETIRACTTDVFIDCPWRERTFWVNDLIVENIVALQAFGDWRINAHALRLAFSNVRKDGWVSAVCPDDGWDMRVLVPTNLYLILMLRDYELYSGDRGFVDELLPNVEKILELFAGLRNEAGLVVPSDNFWNFFDWSYELNDIRMNGYNTSLLNWLYCWVLNIAADFLAIRGRKSKGNGYRQLAAETAGGIDRQFWVEKEQRYADWLEKDGVPAVDGVPSSNSSQLTHAFALLSGSLPAHRKSAAIKALGNPALRMPEMYLHHFVFAAMKQTGVNGEAMARIGKYWGKIADSNSPTLWEAVIHQEGRSAFGDTGSLCHGFSCTPIDYFQTAVLGIAPLEAGFKTFSVWPVAHHLDFAEGRVPTPHGSIRIRWERQEGDALLVELSVPYGTEALCLGKTLGPGTHRYLQGDEFKPVKTKEHHEKEILCHSR